MHRILRDSGDSRLGNHIFVKMSITMALRKDIKRPDIAKIRNF
jgi:hypothetical protein